MRQEEYNEEEVFEEEYYEQEYIVEEYIDERCDYEKHWADSGYYEEARFM